MLLRSLSRVSRFVHHRLQRNYYSSKINSLFINNFDKYFDRIKNDESSYTSKNIKKLLGEFTQLTGSIKDVEKELSGGSQSDKEMLGLMQEEKLELESKRSELITQILDEVFSYEQSKDAERIPDSSSILFEISAGVGGKEAMLFSNELFHLYFNYFQYKRWEIKDVESDEQSDYMRHYKATVEGANVWGCMKFEAGVHRVQRVPETEARGRLHTSTVSIACIPITGDASIDINGEFVNLKTKISDIFRLQKRT